MNKEDLIKSIQDSVSQGEQIITLVFRRDDFISPESWVSEDPIEDSEPALELWNAFVSFFEKQNPDLMSEIGSIIGEELLEFYRQEKMHGGEK